MRKTVSKKSVTDEPMPDLQVGDLVWMRRFSRRERRFAGWERKYVHAVRGDRVSVAADRSQLLAARAKRDQVAKAHEARLAFAEILGDEPPPAPRLPSLSETKWCPTAAVVVVERGGRPVWHRESCGGPGRLCRPGKPRRGNPVHCVRCFRVLDPLKAPRTAQEGAGDDAPRGG